jgi:Protein of unknown function (DUF2889)
LLAGIKAGIYPADPRASVRAAVATHLIEQRGTDMPLPPAAARKTVHTRTYDCRGYEREDGLWDIEGHLVDTKSFTWKNRAGRDLPAGEPAHDMWMRLTIDRDGNIHDAVAVTDAGPFSPCGDITPKFAALKGKRIGRGWTKALKDLIGGPHGCTHHWELLGRIATVAYQTTYGANRSKPRKAGELPYQFNTCHMYAPDSPETLRAWPDLYTGSQGRTEAPGRRA